MAITLTEHDQREIANSFPTLNCNFFSRIIWGTLNFSCSYDRDTKEIVFNDSLENFIEDSYEIRIDFNQHDSFGFPKVFEESAIIKNFSVSNGIKLENLHINTEDEDSCCLGVFPEYKWAGAQLFIREKVIPFFYWQSHKRIYGEEPWKAYSHGIKGIIEAMRFHPREVSKGNNRNKKCPCGSNLKYKACCLQRDLSLKKLLK